jgi:hypothetical protein
MMNQTLVGRFCEKRRVPAARCAPARLSHCLYPWARLLQRLLRAINPEDFERDLERIRATGRLKRATDLATAVAEFNYQPANSGRLRCEGKLRASVTRLQPLLLDPRAADAVGGQSMAPCPERPRLSRC